MNGKSREGPHDGSREDGSRDAVSHVVEPLHLQLTGPVICREVLNQRRISQGEDPRMGAGCVRSNNILAHLIP
jgi:hypothetical protein